MGWRRGGKGRRGEGGEKTNKATSLTTHWIVNYKSFTHSIYNDREGFSSCRLKFVLHKIGENKFHM